MQTQFMDLAAAADFLGPGAVEINRYQSEITDIVRRRGVFGQRIKQVPATGDPSRFFEQTAINSPSAANAFVDPRSIVAPVGTPTRVAGSVPLKASADVLVPGFQDLLDARHELIGDSAIDHAMVIAERQVNDGADGH